MATCTSCADDVRTVDSISHTVKRLGWHRFEHLYEWIDRCFTKLHVLELPHEKVLFLDADMLCVAPGVESVFALEAPAGVLTGDDAFNLAFGAPITQDQVGGCFLPHRALREKLVR